MDANKVCLKKFYVDNGMVDCSSSFSSKGEGLYKYFDKGSNSWQCGPCATGCRSCDWSSTKSFTCFSCVLGYYLPTGSRLCLPLPFCAAGTYVSYAKLSTTSFTCEKCPLSCSQCSLLDINNSTSLNCTSCKNGFTLLGSGFCVAQSSQSCTNLIDADAIALYPAKINN